MILVKNFIVPHCLDGRQNEDETDVDCGGSCKPCEGIHFHMVIICWYHLVYTLHSDINVRYNQIINLFAVLIEVQLHALEEASHISWRFQNTNCKSDDDLEVGGNRVYKTNCNLALGQSYTLECKNLGDGWWKSNNLLVENYVYCEYTKGTTLTNITITGNAHTSQIVLSLLIHFIHEVKSDNFFFKCELM